jgi:hypothetical protein
VTTVNVIIDDTDRLHVRVGGGGTDETETSLLERLGQRF